MQFVFTVLWTPKDNWMIKKFFALNLTDYGKFNKFKFPPEVQG